METNPKAAETLKPLLGGANLIWAEEIEIPKQGVGCSIFFGIILGLATLVFFLNGGIGIGLIFGFFTFMILASAMKALPKAVIGISNEHIFLKFPDYTKKIPLKKINEIKLIKGSATTRADIKISTKVKILNTETYKFSIEETEQLINNVPDFYEVIDLMNKVHLQYLNINPPSSSDIEIK